MISLVWTVQHEWEKIELKLGGLDKIGEDEEAKDYDNKPAAEKTTEN